MCVHPLRILIGGSNYGRAYFEALALNAARYQPAALLARGSERSRELASAHGVPLVTSVEAAAEGIDLACLALPPAPREALALLRGGIPVLCEHPQPPTFIEAALAAAHDGRSVFHLNGHFSRLPASTAFIAHARLRQQVSKPVLAMLAATDRSLFAALDILAGVLGPPAAIDIQGARKDGLFTAAGFAWNDVPVSLEMQNRGPADGSEEYRLDYRIALGFADGIVTLLSLAGPVIWNANYARFGASGQSLWSMAHAGAESATELRAQRARANLAAVEDLRECAAGVSTPAHQSPEYLLGVARLWQALGDLL